MMIYAVLFLLPLLLGYLLDLILGDPDWMPHPVRLIGRVIQRLEHFARIIFPETKRGELLAGIALALSVSLGCFLIPLLFLIALYQIHPWLSIGVEAVMCYQILAVKSLRTESMKVHDALAEGDVEKAREKVSMIVGRDTGHLTEEQIAKAAIETVAENTSDGIVAPMIYMAIGGAPLGFLYKGINTMDSMIGYKSEIYLYFGKFAARLDDLANFIPARISAALMMLSAVFAGYDGKNSWRIFQRDRYNHASPNSAQTEAVCAGALRIQLAGDAYYFGKLYPKKTIGDPLKPVEYVDIMKANRLLYTTAALSIILCIAIRAGLCYLGEALW